MKRDGDRALLQPRRPPASPAPSKEMSYSRERLIAIAKFRESAMNGIARNLYSDNAMILRKKIERSKKTECIPPFRASNLS